MNVRVIDLTEEQSEYIDAQLQIYDKEYIKYRLDGCVQIGIEKEGKLIAGLNAYMTAFKILYVDSVFVAEDYRRQGLGKELICEMEQRAKGLGANMVRLDTFDWQGYEFYKSLGYEEVGHYYNDIDNFHEYFFVKRI
jgi:GNAT superfamily N-acetyltransferase